MIRGLVAPAIVVMSILASQTATLAEPARRAPCGDRNKIIAHLNEGYGEVPVSRGLDAAGRVVEVLAAPSGSWSLLVSMPSGLTCLAASGVAWEDLKPAPSAIGQEH